MKLEFHTIWTDIECESMDKYTTKVGERLKLTVKSIARGGRNENVNERNKNADVKHNKIGANMKHEVKHRKVQHQFSWME